MRRLLFLAHRIPYPPQKGEKIRAWHMLDYLAERWEVDLGCLVDDRADLEYLPVLQSRCAEVQWWETGSRRQSALRALLRFRPGKPLTLGWFHNPSLAAWVEQGLAAGRWDAAFAYSSSMAPYLLRKHGLRRVLDMVDVDSEKWRAYAEGARGVMRPVWAREARTLLGFERQAALDFNQTLLVSPEEAQRFADLAPDCADRLNYVNNGVDLSRFDPDRTYLNPYAGTGPALVFTGTMDYRPNVDAVCWFADTVMPLLAGRSPAPTFHIVGANPAPAVRALASRPGVQVTGAVPDIRPFIAHAAVAVAPLRIARGIQNKVLEAMAMARPVVASPEAYEGVRAVAGQDLLVAASPAEMAARIGAVLEGEHPGIGERARRAVMKGHDWSATLRRLDPILSGEADAKAMALPALAEERA
ncbi:TIGR03087 family PEP-CTERM/XrtA system glycosyltransferase [Roseomonas sp. SSH11]|uniref:TIGR03087 family PEP-CTERM/XrtA system glycosyltransferase n=1 Tax=Pararoseomonas baculiformis TaxID=2820812 RepID=A0ABS4AF26_9PROT|nr:TIGR03087 family PEP-CTERM/XrtA system glycosyltransferase [Pararoseomonas baculiformis]MBP0445133.1 TIGR03087 family PEP-CTERM/XrtA system glycosyltransferase [Pararoseomonas baculiformis]